MYRTLKNIRENQIRYGFEAGQNYSAKQMLFGTKLSLEPGQVLREFIPVFSIQAKRHICHKLVKTQRKPLVLVWWLQNDSRKIKILKHEIIATYIANRIRNNATCVDCTGLVNSLTLAKILNF